MAAFTSSWTTSTWTPGAACPRAGPPKWSAITAAVIDSRQAPGEGLISSSIEEHLMPFLDIHRRTPAFCVLAVLALALTPGASPAAIVNVDVFSNDFGNFSTGQHVDPTITLGDTIHWIFQQGIHNTQSNAGQTESW